MAAGIGYGPPSGLNPFLSIEGCAVHSAEEQGKTSSLMNLLDERLKVIEPNSHITDAFIGRMVIAFDGNYRGLRHVSSPEVQAREKLYGTRGDSLNLSFIAENQTFGMAQEDAKFRGSPLRLPVEEKKKIYADYESGINKFFMLSYSLDLPFKEGRSRRIELGETTLRDMWDSLQNTRFSLVCYDSSWMPYDFHSYFGMGKFGEADIFPTALTSLPPLTLDDLGLKDEQLDHVLQTDAEHDAWFDLLKAHHRRILFRFNGPFFRTPEHDDYVLPEGSILWG